MPLVASISLVRQRYTTAVAKWLTTKV